MTGRRPGPGWFLDPGCGEGSVVLKWQLGEQDLRTLLRPFWPPRPPQASAQSAAQWAGPARPVEMTILWDPSGQFVIPIPAPLGSLMPS